MSDHLDLVTTLGADLAARRAPDVAVDRRLGGVERQVGDATLLGVVEVVLSVYLGEGRSRRASDVYCLLRTIAACGRTEIIRDGAVVAAPFPELREMPWPDGGKGLRALGLTRPQLGQLWLRAQHEQGSMAVLDREILCTLVPLELWGVLAALIVEGPGIVVERLERYLLELAMRPVRPNRARRPGATHSKRCLTSFATTLRRVMGILSDLHRRGAVHPSLSEWGAPPRVKVPRAAAANTDRSAPARHQLRHTYRRLDAAYKERFGVGCADDELAVLEAGVADQLVARGAWRLGRNRALFGLLCVTGSRIGAALALMLSDFNPVHVDPDGNVGPAIALRPGKTMEADDVRWKPLPTGAGQMIQAHVLLTRRLALETDGPGEFTRRRRARLPEDYPLFPASIKYLERPWHSSGFYEALAGRATGPPARQTPWFGVLRRDTQTGEAPPDGRLGYSPHALRRAALQMVRDGGREFCEERRLPHSPEVIASALLDHEIRSDPYGYADHNTLQGRERLSSLGAQIAWEMLTTDRGARRIKNAAAYREAVRKRDVLKAELDRTSREIAAAVQQARAARKVPADLLLDLLANDERSELQTRLAAVEAEIHNLIHSPRTMIAAPDDISDEQLRREIEAFEKTVRQNHAKPKRAAPHHPDPIRDWITIPELAEVLDISYPTAARWVRGEHLPHPAGDPRNPWPADNVPVDVSLGERRRRIWTGGVNAAVIRTEAQNARLAQLLAQPPKGWSDKHVSGPLRLPEPFASRREAAHDGERG
jgi:integrase